MAHGLSCSAALNFFNSILHSNLEIFLCFFFFMLLAGIGVLLRDI